MKSPNISVPSFTERFAENPQSHPNLEWAKKLVRERKGDRVTEEELETLQWYPLGEYYGMTWKGMFLGIEKDGHLHT